jgi:hypothetical protein
MGGKHADYRRGERAGRSRMRTLWNRSLLTAYRRPLSPQGRFVADSAPGRVANRDIVAI